MVPLFNISFSGIGFSLHGRTDCLSSTVNFSLAAQSYNDKYEAWEPLVEPVDGFLRYFIYCAYYIKLKHFTVLGIKFYLVLVECKDIR